MRLELVQPLVAAVMDRRRAVGRDEHVAEHVGLVVLREDHHQILLVFGFDQVDLVFTAGDVVVLDHRPDAAVLQSQAVRAGAGRSVVVVLVEGVDALEVGVVVQVLADLAVVVDVVRLEGHVAQESV